MMQGRIIKAMAGYYHVKNEEGTFLTRARGLFRHEKITPAVGDLVDFEPDLLHEEGMIHTIHPRENLLQRPRVSNITSALLVFSLIDPSPDFLLMDKLICNVLHQQIRPILVFNKTDLPDLDTQEIFDIYEKTPLEVHFVSAVTGEGVEKLKSALEGGIHVVAGPSGAGKSSLLNALDVPQVLEVGEISAKLRRGKHTTRHVQLLPLGEDTYIVDTPGFTNLDLDEQIDPLLLREYYEEFSDFSQACRYMNCLHAPEPACAVKEALGRGDISARRYEHYLTLLEQSKERKDYL